MRKPSLTPMLCRKSLATSAPASVVPASPKPAPRPLRSSSARKLSLGLFIAASTRPSGGRALGVRERRGDGRDAAERRVRHADAGGAQLLRQRARRGQRRVVDVAAVAREALVERERRERTAVRGHARPPVGHAARRVEVPVVGHHAAGDARHAQALEAGDEVVDVPRLHAVVARLERRGGERRVAEAAEVDVAVDDAGLVRPRGVDEELRAEAERRRPAGQRRRRGDELLVGGRQAQHVRPQLVHGALGGEVEDGDRGA